jgi:hypothetical protein
MFSNLPPEDLASAGRCSLWRVFKLVLDALIHSLASLLLLAIEQADARTHQLLADPRRKRKRQMFSLPMSLS